MVQSEYLGCVLSNKKLAETIKLVAAKCRKAVKQYNKDLKKPISSIGLTGQGLSGALVIPSVALKLGYSFAIVRKDNESCHSGYTVEGDLSFKYYIFIDDFIDTGCSFCHVNDEMFNLKIRPLAIVQYHPDWETALHTVIDHLEDKNYCRHEANNLARIKKLICL